MQARLPLLVVLFGLLGGACTPGEGFDAKPGAGPPAPATHAGSSAGGGSGVGAGRPSVRPDPAVLLGGASRLLVETCLDRVAEGRQLVPATAGTQGHRPMDFGNVVVPDLVGFPVPGLDGMIVLSASSRPSCGAIVDGVSRAQLVEMLARPPFATSGLVPEGPPEFGRNGSWTRGYRIVHRGVPIYVSVQHVPASGRVPPMAGLMAFRLTGR